MKLRNIITILGVLCVAALSGQTHDPVDSMKALLTIPSDDTTRMNRLSSLVEMIGPNEEGQKYNGEILAIARETMNSPDSSIARRSRIHYANSLGNEGYIAEIKGDIPTALANYEEALAILKAENMMLDVSSILNNIGYVYNGLGDIPTCIQYYEASLAIRDSINDMEGIATCLNNLATVYRDQGETDTALIYFQRFRDICITIKDSSGLALALTNIGNTYLIKHDTTNASKFLNEGLAVSRSINDERGIGHALLGLGNLHFEAKRFNQAREYFAASLEHQSKADYRRGIANTKLRLAETDLILGNTDHALTTAKEAYEMAKKIGYVDLMQNSAATLKDIYKAMGETGLALEMYELEIKMRDSLRNESNRKTVIRNQLKNEYDKKQAIIDAEHKAELDRRNLVLWGTGIGLVLLIVFSVFIYTRFRVIRSQKKIIEQQKVESDNQKQLIEVKNKEILDSISYARRLQEAILPPMTLVSTMLPQSFILYLPKDIVAGDFYWMERTANRILFAAADCTGHGVPGAMVSVVCSNALNRAVKEFGLTDPGKILDKVRELILQTFERSTSAVNDGMDIALISIPTHGNNGTIEYAGANRPLFIIRNGQQTVEEILPNKQPVGLVENPKPFTTQQLAMHSGDTIYLMTDGFADQFGGKDVQNIEGSFGRGKKLKNKALQQFLIKNSSAELSQQRELLSDFFASWKGNLEQVDDVLIAGVRF